MGNDFAGTLRRCGALSSTGVLAWLGLSCILIWNQCVLYSQRIGADAGVNTVIISAIRCAFILVLLAFAASPLLKGKLPRWWEIVSIAFMSCAGMSLLADNLIGASFARPACILFSALGITWGGGMWVQIYARLGIRSLFSLSIFAMAFSGVAGVVVCYIPWEMASCLGIILPVASYACYTSVMADIEQKRPADLLGTKADSPALSLARAKIGEGLRMFAGIAAFSLALGIVRGYPDGSILVIPSAMLPAQFVIVVLVCLALLYWSLRPEARPNAGILWACYIAALAMSVFLISSSSDAVVGFGATLLSAVNLLQVLMLWLLACDTAKHSTRPAFVALAAFWLVHLFFRELGRASIILFPAQTHTDQVFLLASIICLLAVAVALLLVGRSPSGALFFSDFEYTLSNPKQPSVDISAAEASAVAADDGNREAQAGFADAGCPEWLKEAYGLTARECEVAGLLGRNLSAAKIGDELFLSKETVRSYTKSIYAKTGVHSKDELSDLLLRRSRTDEG